MDQPDQLLRLSSTWTAFDRLAIAADSLLCAFLLVSWILLRSEIWLLLIAAGFGLRAALFWKRYSRLKDVSLSQGTVYASSLAKTISFPVASIASIELDPSGQRAALNLREPTIFGRRIEFLPRGKTVQGFNPILEQLQVHLVDQEKASAVSV